MHSVPRRSARTSRGVAPPNIESRWRRGGMSEWYRRRASAQVEGERHCRRGSLPPCAAHVKQHGPGSFRYVSVAHARLRSFPSASVLRACLMLRVVRRIARAHARTRSAESLCPCPPRTAQGPTAAHPSHPRTLRSPRLRCSSRSWTPTALCRSPPERRRWGRR